MNYTIEFQDPAGDQVITSRDYFEKQREELAIQQAYDSGYIRDATKTFIEEKLNTKSEDIEALTLRHLNIRNIDGVPHCYRLTVCNLSSNFIADISALASCPHLVKVDLSSNQITSFPHLDFWSSFINLQFLLLHDNGFGKLNCIQSLSLAPALEFLTLFDTPISIRPSYRHHVVNSIITLKVLDYHVVADEEVIEDARFPEKFRALSHNLYLPLCDLLKLPTHPNSTSSKAEKALLNQISFKLHKILSKFSPVVIIQKTVRGFFARKFRKYLIENRIWITAKDDLGEADDSTIQEVDERKSKDVEVPKGEKPSLQVRFKDGKSSKDVLTKELRNMKIEKSRENTTFLPHPPVPTPKATEKISLPAAIMMEKEKTSVSTDQPIDEKSLERLKFLLQNISPEDVRPFINHLAEPSSHFDWLQMASAAHHIKVEKKERELIRMQEAKLKTSQISKEQLNRSEKTGVPRDEDTENDTDFKMQGFRLPLYKSEPLKEYLDRIMEAVNDTRVAHERYHKENDHKLVPKAPKFAFTTLDQLVYSKHKGCMSLATFLAVDRAYQAKTKEDQLQAKQDKVYEMRVDKKKAKHKFVLKNKQRAKQFSNLQDYDETVTRAAKRERDEYYHNVKEKYRDAVEERARTHSKKREDFKFAQEFASHCSSIGNALRKHDLKVKSEDRSLAMTRRVRDMQGQRDEQKSIIKNYVNQRQKVLQAESNAERAEIELKILQEDKARREEVKERVDELKRVTREVKELYPVPLHIHVGRQPQPGFQMGPNQSIYSVYSMSNKGVNKPKSPLTRLAERKILTNQSYNVIHQRVRSAGSGTRGSVATPAIVHVDIH